MWEQNAIKVIRPRQIISLAWKWLGDEKVQALSLPMFDGYKRDKHNNKALIVELHKLFSQADIVVGHNVKRFDDRRSNTDIIKHGLKPPPPHKSVDTLEFARFKFDFNSNKLDDLGEFLGVGRKVKHPGFEMWEKCLDGDTEAWEMMVRYNKGDVALLERIYLKLRPWMTSHPALKPRENTNKNPPCPLCHARKLQSKGVSISRAGVAPRYHCQACGHWSMGIRVKKEWRVK